MQRIQYLTLALSALFIWTACGTESTAPMLGKAAVRQQNTEKANPPDGAAIYRQYCVTCHGADGKLGLNDAGDLSLSDLSLEMRITQISKGKNMMAAFEEILSAEEIRAVAEFTLSLKK